MVQPDPNFYRRPEVFGPGPTLLNNLGEPIPPQDVVVRLKAIDPRLSIEWVAGAWGQAYFGLFERWRPGDPRWERVQTGELPEAKARDLIQTFPRECQPSEMAAFVENRWGNRGRDPKAEADALIARAEKLYAQHREESIEKVVDHSMEKFADESTHSIRLRAGTETAHPMVAGIGEGTMKSEPKRLIEVATK